MVGVAGADQMGATENGLLAARAEFIPNIQLLGLVQTEKNEQN